MKDVCVIRQSGGRKVSEARLKALLDVYMLPGERADIHLVDENTKLVEIHRVRSPVPPSQAHVSEAFAYAYSGYVRPAFRSPLQLGGGIKVLHGQASCPESPGGIAAHFFMDRLSGSVFAWQSLSNWERVYFTQRDGLVVISNSALLSHGLAADGLPVATNKAWMEDVIIGLGSAIEHTQFVGTFALPSRRCLRVDADGSVHKTGWPVQFLPFERDPGSQEAVEDVAHELSGSISAMPSQQDTLFRLSSGKDSRLIAAVLGSKSYIPNTVHYGEVGSPKTELALHIGRVLGIPVAVSHTAQSDAGQVNRVMRTMTRWADYSYLTAQHLTKPVDEFGDAKCLVEGHAHHLRGGFSSLRFSTDASCFNKYWRQFIAGAAFAPGHFLETKREQIRGIWSDLRSTYSPLESLYIGFIDRRMVLNPQVNFRRRSRIIDQVPPMMDERVILATSRANTYDLASEFLFHRVLRCFSEPATRIPLEGKQWRFEELNREPLGLEKLKEIRRGSKTRTKELRTLWPTLKDDDFIVERDPINFGSHLPEIDQGQGKFRNLSKDLRYSVKLLNRLKSVGLPYDLKEFTVDQALLGDEIKHENVKKNGKTSKETNSFVWKLISYAIVAGPKKPTQIKGTLPRG